MNTHSKINAQLSVHNVGYSLLLHTTWWMLQYEKECLVAHLYITLYETVAVSQHSAPSILIKYTGHLHSTMCNILGDNLHNTPAFMVR